jgi:hypothetical protein
MLRLVALAMMLLALLGATCSQSYPPPPSSGEPQAEHEANPANKHDNPQSDERGTPEAPLFIQIQQPPNQYTIASYPQSEGDWYTRPDWWMAGFTAALFLSTTGLWVFTGLMWYQIRRDSANIYRPRLHIRHISLNRIITRIPNIHLTNGHQFEFVISVSNIGGSKATITSGQYRVFYQQDIPIGPDVFGENALPIMPVPTILPIGANRIFELTDTLAVPERDPIEGTTTIHRLEFNSSNRRKLIVIGDMWYEDEISVRRAVGFHRELHSDYRFHAVKGSDYEYED